MLVICVKNLIVEGKHGIHQHEKDRAQRFNVNVELALSSNKAGISDNINDTLNWSELRNTILAIAKSSSFNLVESLAQEIADQVLLDKRVVKAIVSVDKLDAFKSGVPGVRLELFN